MVIVHLIRIIRQARRHRAFGFALVLLLLGIAIGGNTAAFYVFDGGGDTGITVGDALWYSIISMTTIGYGDYSATSLGARVGTVVFVVIFGLAAFSLFLGLLIDWFTGLVLRGERGMGTVHAVDHTLVVHFPSAARVEQLIKEIQCDRAGGSGEVVVVTDQIERLPFSMKDVIFVSGSTLAAETYRRAMAMKASKAIVLATSYSDPNSDAVVASAVSVLDSINPDLHIVAECLNDDHRRLFDSVRCDAVIAGLRITGNLLVQESQDPGISQTFDLITSNLAGDTLYSTEIGEPDGIPGYPDLLKILMDHDVNVLSVARGEETFTTFGSLAPQAGDRLVYLAGRRWSWDELRKAGSEGA